MYVIENNVKTSFVNGNHGKHEVTAIVIGSVPGSRSYLAKLIKGEEKMNELVGKIKFLLMKTSLFNIFFQWYSLSPCGNYL